MKKLTFLFASILFTVMSGIMIWSARAYSDVPAKQSEQGAIQYLSGEGILRGTGNGKSFEPNKLLNRAEWATIIVRYKKETPSIKKHGFCFQDVWGEWFAPSVCLAKEKGWVKGYESKPGKGFFGAGDPLNIAELVVSLERLFIWPGEKGSDWFSGAYEYAALANIIPAGDSPDKLLTRAEVAEILFRTIAVKKFNLIKYDPIIADFLMRKEESKDEKTIGSKLTTVSVSKFPDYIKKSTIAVGASYVPVLRFRIEVEKTVILQEFSVKRVSVGRTEDIEYAHLMVNGKTIQEKSFTGARNSVVWRNLSLTLNPGEVFLVEMSVDFVPDALTITNYIFELNPENMRFDKAVKINGKIMRGGSFTLVQVPSSFVSISNSSHTLKKPFIEGEKQIIGRFDITAGESDVLIKRIRLEDAGFINNKNFKNFRLSVGSKDLGFLSSIDGSVLDFSIDDYFLEKNKTRAFTVRADIGLARKSDFIRLFMDMPNHLYAFDIEKESGARVINKFGYKEARCVGSNSSECPTEGLRKRCSRDDIKYGTKDCEQSNTPILPANCDSTLAPVCGAVGEDIPKTFDNRCLAEKASAIDIRTGRCSDL